MTMRARLDDWRGLLARHVPQAQQILKKLLAGPVRFMPEREGIRQGWRFSGAATLESCLRGRRLQLRWRPQRDSNPRFSLERAAS